MAIYLTVHVFRRAFCLSLHPLDLAQLKAYHVDWGPNARPTSVDLFLNELPGCASDVSGGIVGMPILKLLSLCNDRPHKNAD
jgi:hypothetical protein